MLYGNVGESSGRREVEEHGGLKTRLVEGLLQLRTFNVVLACFGCIHTNSVGLGILAMTHRAVGLAAIAGQARPR